MRTVVVVDDETDMRLLVRLILEQGEFEVVAEAIDGSEGLDAIVGVLPPNPDVVVLDNQMPGLSGLQVARELQTLRPGVPIVLFSAHLSPEVKAEAASAGIARCVAKEDLPHLPAVLAAVLEAG